MQSNLELLKQQLKENGYSVTAARTLVFEVLEYSKPLTMNQLVQKLHSEVNRASIYRVIALFEKLGIIQRIQIGWKFKLELSNEYQEHHHHLICVSCGNIQSFHEQDALKKLLKKSAADNSFALESHQLELHGICAKCTNQNLNKSALYS